MSLLPSTILWRRLDRPGHEAARLVQLPSGWHLSGVAVFTHDNLPCRLDYQVHCDAAWQTVSAQIEGWVGHGTISVEIVADSSHRWSANGKECIEVEGCIDLDLNFSPSTNLLPVRRLNLVPGDAAAVKAAWLRFPSFSLEPLEQIYHRLDAVTYRYESAGGRFVADLQVNTAGFVTDYPNLWASEAYA